MKAVVISSNPKTLTEIKDIPLPQINDDEILIKTKAIALNPTDWKHIIYQLSSPGDLVGSDVSGVVEAVGSSVENIKVGDFVSSFIAGNFTTRYGAFSEYVIANPQATVKYPTLTDDISTDVNSINSFIGAASVTLGLTTIGMSYSNTLNIPKRLTPGDFILIWAGSTTTGLLAIQLAKMMYNLKVITTASPKNFKLVKSYGADYVFDYNDPNVVDKIKEIGQNRIKFGLDIIATKQTFQNVYDTTAGTPKVYLDNLDGLDKTAISVVSSRDVHFERTAGYLAIIKEKQFGDFHFEQTSEMMKNYLKWWYDELPKYITQIKHPKLVHLDKGFESVNDGLSMLMSNKVSAKKVVISI
ncbi:unnamed protein product [Candida verbasci]|uniref:Enoyl reductase (ER) domain-containing protein n=1 Tax=Candida verbasci TaxID=1227364 RepID=A0A9W4TWR6_9ASCO|nr:unnamed protein product [Candida verbasci]